VRELFIQSEGHRLHAWHVAGLPGAPLVLYFGGNAEEVSWMLEEVGAPLRSPTPGAGWLLVDYRGYGASEGAPSEKALIADALGWYDSVAATNKTSYVFGRSLGSGVAVQLAAARPVAGLVLVTPFDSLTAVAKRHYWFLPVDWLLKHRFDSIGLAPRLATPLLCLAAARDEIVPVAHARRLYDAWAGPKRWVDLAGAGHNSTDGAPDFWRSVKAFLERPHGPP
jgi:pimeloyl-ACP methyl ester carboxylesterase